MLKSKKAFEVIKFIGIEAAAGEAYYIRRLARDSKTRDSYLNGERKANVSPRSIQMYEQRNKDINKAQAITLAKISRVLGCAVEDLLE